MLLLHAVLTPINALDAGRDKSILGQSQALRREPR